MTSSNVCLRKHMDFPHVFFLLCSQIPFPHIGYNEKHFKSSLLRTYKAKIHTKGMVIQYARYQKQLASLRRFP